MNETSKVTAPLFIVLLLVSVGMVPALISSGEAAAKTSAKAKSSRKDDFHLDLPPKTTALPGQVVRLWIPNPSKKTITIRLLNDAAELSVPGEKNQQNKATVALKPGAKALLTAKVPDQMGERREVVLRVKDKRYSWILEAGY